MKRVGNAKEFPRQVTLEQITGKLVHCIYLRSETVTSDKMTHGSQELHVFKNCQDLREFSLWGFGLLNTLLLGKEAGENKKGEPTEAIPAMKSGTTIAIEYRGKKDGFYLDEKTKKEKKTKLHDIAIYDMSEEVSQGEIFKTEL